MAAEKYFEPGDIVVIEKHLIEYVIGRMAEVKSGPHMPERCAQLHPLLPASAPGEAWYVLIDQVGQMRAAAHSWLRRVPPAWVPERTHELGTKPTAEWDETLA